jgi:hypothetical protein
MLLRAVVWHSCEAEHWGLVLHHDRGQGWGSGCIGGWCIHHALSCSHNCWQCRNVCCCQGDGLILLLLYAC